MTISTASVSSSSRISIVVAWPRSVPIEPAGEVLKALSKNWLPATWAVEHTSQSPAVLAAAGEALGHELAVLANPAKLAVAGATAEQATADGIARQVSAMAAVRQAASTVVMSAAGGRNELRRLHAAGVRSVVNEVNSREAGVRLVPYGLWQFTPLASVPRVRRWWSWFVPSRVGAVPGGGSCIAVNLTQLAARGGWRELETTLARISEERRAGRVAVVTVGEATQQLTGLNAPRPQRSILRAA